MRSIDSAEVGAIFFDSSTARKEKRWIKQPKPFTDFDEARLRMAEEKRQPRKERNLRIATGV
jgi:hypothetical protein